MGSRITASPASRKRRVWKWVGVGALLLLAVLGVAAQLIVRRAQPILKSRVLETLRNRFDSKVELDELSVSVVHELEVSGGGLRIYPPEEVVAAGAAHPIFSVDHFSFHAGLAFGN